MDLLRYNNLRVSLGIIGLFYLLVVGQRSILNGEDKKTDG